jgi:hypothetical protein
MKSRNPIDPVHGVEFENAGGTDRYKFDNTLADLPNIVKKNIFTKDQVSRIYEMISKSNGREFANPARGQSYLDMIDIPKDVIDTVQAVAEEATGEKWKLADYALCTYNNELGFPELKMHRDENFDEQRVCFDYQLESNTSWDIIVGEERYELEDNSGILFSSTDQYHGRPKKEFKDEDQIKLIFFHMSKSGINDSNIAVD